MSTWVPVSATVVDVCACMRIYRLTTLNTTNIHAWSILYLYWYLGMEYAYKDDDDDDDHFNQCRIQFIDGTCILIVCKLRNQKLYYSMIRQFQSLPSLFGNFHCVATLLAFSHTLLKWIVFNLCAECDTFSEILFLSNVIITVLSSLQFR